MHSRIVFFEILARGAVHVLLLLFAFRIAQDISHTRTCTSARIFARPLSRARAPRRAATSGTLYTVTPYSRNSVLSPLDSSLATSPPGTGHSAHALEPLSPDSLAQSPSTAAHDAPASARTRLDVNDAPRKQTARPRARAALASTRNAADAGASPVPSAAHRPSRCWPLQRASVSLERFEHAHEGAAATAAAGKRPRRR